MARVQARLAHGLTIDFDDVTGAYRLSSTSARVLDVEVDDGGTPIRGTVDPFADAVSDADGRTLAFKRRNQSRSGAAVPIIRVVTRSG